MAEDKHMTLAEAVAQVQRSVVVPKARYNATCRLFFEDGHGDPLDVTPTPASL